jgi:alanine racemase
MAVIKANAYGHGMIPVARALGAVDCLAVARMSEARALRTAGFRTPVVVLGGPLAPDDIDEAAALDIQLAFHDQQQIRWLERSKGKLDAAWLKVDTGMNRLGVATGQAADSIQRVTARVRTLSLMTHFSSADNPDDPTTAEQLSRFLPLIRQFKGDVSVANSPGLLAWGDTLEQLAEIREVGCLWIRPGLALYGISPFPNTCGTDLGLQPAMQFEATLTSVKPIRRGDRVGYGGAWTAQKDTTLGVVAVGYGDGYTRFIPSGTPVVVNNRRAPVAGRISMDLTAIDLGPAAAEQVGDRVTLWGAALPVETIARHAGTIAYELVTGVSHREAPFYDE